MTKVAKRCIVSVILFCETKTATCTFSVDTFLDFFKKWWANSGDNHKINFHLLTINRHLHSIKRLLMTLNSREASPGYEFAYTTCAKNQFSFLCSSIKTLKFKNDNKVQ